MAAPGVSIKEIDLSQRVESFPGIYAGIVIPAKKGFTEPVLVTTDTEFLSLYTPNNKVEVNYDTSYFSALSYLEYGNKLWVVRAINSALHAGASFRKSSSTYSNFSLSVGLADPTSYVFDSLPDEPAIAEETRVTTVADVAKSLNSKYFYINSTTSSYYVWFNVDGFGIDPSPAGKIGIEVNISENDTADMVATALKNKLNTMTGIFSANLVASNIVRIVNIVAGAVVDASDENTGFTVVVTIQGTDAISYVDEAMLIYSMNEGAWGNDVGIKLINYATNPDLVKEPDAFLIQVFKRDNQSTPVEQFVCSRRTNAKDGYNRNIYVVEALKASNYIRAFDNSAIDELISPKDQTSILWLNGGDDGLAVTDSHMISALNKLNNEDNIPLVLILDGGWVSPAYQLAIESLASQRRCVGILSTQYQDEADSNYISALLTYRKSTLNLSSSYVGMYTPHVLIYDRFNDRKIFISPDGFVAGAISRSALNYEIWYPPAGFSRGMVKVLDLRRRFTVGEQDALYDAGLNPIRFVPGRGIVIWGQKTMLSRPSALDRMNVRLLLVVIEPAIKRLLEDFTFELNDDVTRLLVTSKIDSFMTDIRARRGVTEYLVVCDTTNNTPQVIDANRLVVDLFIKPTRSAEFIEFRVVLTSTGISLESAAGLL